MPYCHRCGTEVAEGTNYCPHCGAAIGAVAYPEAVPRKYSGIGATLVLIGGIIALISELAHLATAAFWISDGFMHSMMEMPWFLGRFLGGLLFIGSLFAFGGGIAAIFLWYAMRRERVEIYGALAIALGMMLILAMNFLSGIIVVVGGILHYTSMR